MKLGYQDKSWAHQKISVKCLKDLRFWLKAIRLVPHGPNIPVPLLPTESQKIYMYNRRGAEGIFVGPDILKLMKDK
ncbi:hypothetical protein TNCV_1746911 [Trichonephila clavipes]|nr:hypothetical protein TNCV_1746911 [Trichonephila clavipes]